VNPVYNHLVYNSDITYQGKTLSTKGKQLLDVPKWTIVSGLIMKYKDFEVIPQMRYIGKRYGDCEHNEEVPSYAVFDLKLNYVKEKLGMLKALKLSLELDNIFDKKHVSVINAMDDSITGTTYYAAQFLKNCCNLCSSFSEIAHDNAAKQIQNTKGEFRPRPNLPKDRLHLPTIP
jgi:iron complex outermembrane receptor protein